MSRKIKQVVALIVLLAIGIAGSNTIENASFIEIKNTIADLATHKKDKGYGNVMVVKVPTITYLVIAKRGIGHGFYREREVVTLEADEASEGMVFSRWEGLNDVIFLEGNDKENKLVQFLMPASTVTAGAIYEMLIEE